MVYKVLLRVKAEQSATGLGAHALSSPQPSRLTSSFMHVKPASPQDIRRVDLALPSSIGLHAVRLIEQASDADHGQLIYLSEGENRAEQMAQALKGLAPDLDVCLLPPWDCLPYDNTSPSREAMGRRMSVLRRMSEPAKGTRL